MEGADFVFGDEPASKLDVNGIITAKRIVGLEKLYVNGKITAKEIAVGPMEGADFVFGDNYKLKSLFEVERFINKNKHLPNIPSATEMKENGLNMCEFQIKLLQKIEESTIRMIGQEKKIKELEKTTRNLKFLILFIMFLVVAFKICFS